MIKRIELGDLVRCKFWLTCNAKDCFHQKAHRAERASCFSPTPVHYCEEAEGFVYDIDVSDSNPIYDCDPNLAFKARRESREFNRNRKKNESEDEPSEVPEWAQGWIRT